MVGPVFKSHVNIHSQILKCLSWQGKDKVHGNRFKIHCLQGQRQGGNIHGPSPQNILVFLLKGLDTNADPGYPGFL